MGHLVGKDIFRELGRKIDSLETRAPWNDTLHAILKELYSEQEAELVVKMPHGLSTIEQLERSTGYESVTLLRTLDGLTAKGLVMDLCINDRYYYAVSPLVIGIFEFTMMRTGPSANSKVWAKLLHEYLLEGDAFMAANFGKGDQVTADAGASPSRSRLFGRIPRDPRLREGLGAARTDRPLCHWSLQLPPRKTPSGFKGVRHSPGNLFIFRNCCGFHDQK